MSVTLVILTACLLALGHGLVVIEPVQIYGRVGENVVITCIVGTVEPDFTRLLTDNNQQLVTNSQDVQSDRVVFGYGPLTLEDDDRLVICDFGSESADGTILLLFSPFFSLDPLERDVSEGSLLYTVMVNVTGDPLPTNQDTSWTFNGGPLGNKVAVTYNSISFERVSREHSGVYTVSSVTVAGPSNILNITINVLYPPTFTTGLSTGIACGGVSSPFICAVMVGGSGSLNCAAVGFHVPILNITESSPRIIGDVSTGVVTINSIIAEDNEATVECSVTNSEGTVQRSFMIYVGRVPAQPTRVVGRVEGNLVVITWEYSDPDNNVPLSEFLYRVNSTTDRDVVSGTKPGNTTTFNISLSLLEGDTRYNVEVRANNLLGSSEVAGTQFTTPRSESGNGSLMSATPYLLSVLLMLSLTTLLSV